tara:strand:- start:4 stop:135 length:132 start_codon:yes stop_codon:yes gene_type:complete
MKLMGTLPVKKGEKEGAAVAERLPPMCCLFKSSFIFHVSLIGE